MIKKSIILFITLAFTFEIVVSQVNEKMEKRPFQFTFMFPPLSTNGSKCSRIINQFSINSFIGFNGGVDGLEIGGFMNNTLGSVKGIQMSGFSNITGGYCDGAQFAGFYNLVKGKTLGFQAAGFANMVRDSVDGAQLAGFANFNKSLTQGIQAAGFLNIVEQEARGLQLAGFTNMDKKFSYGFQGAGFMNLSEETANCSQAAGFANFGGDIKGIQAAGFINVAKKVEGIQLAGFINICDSITGIPIGFINIARKQLYHTFEVSSSEILVANFSFKLGVQHFYNIYSLSKLAEDKNRWAIGLGIGTEKEFGKSSLLNIELLCHQELWLGEYHASSPIIMDRLNLLNQLKVMYGYKIAKRVSVFGGPTMNVSVSHQKHDYANFDYHPMAPSWSIVDIDTNNNNDAQVNLWAGFNFGVRF